MVPDFDTAMAEALSSDEKDRPYTLPSGEEITIKGHVRFQASELLFKPELNDKTAPRLHELAWQSISQCDVDARV